MSGAELLILGKLVLTFGVLLLLPAWELWQLRRERRLLSARPVGTGSPAKKTRDAAESIRLR
jgi:hypothetical protein